ncbi:hypothetical protein ACFLV5_03455 [Chloroflexota bacterium]
MDMQLSNIWLAAAVILGFQVTWFIWRVSREVLMRSKGAPTWLPRADIVNLISMTLIVIGVFILPILGVRDLNIMKAFFGLAILLFVGYPFALIGHYKLYKWRIDDHSYCPQQEKIVIYIIGALTIIYIILSIVIR